MARELLAGADVAAGGLHVLWADCAAGVFYAELVTSTGQLRGAVEAATGGIAAEGWPASA